MRNNRHTQKNPQNPSPLQTPPNHGLLLHRPSAPSLFLTSTNNNSQTQRHFPTPPTDPRRRPGSELPQVAGNPRRQNDQGGQPKRSRPDQSALPGRLGPG